MFNYLDTQDSNIGLKKSNHYQSSEGIPCSRLGAPFSGSNLTQAGPTYELDDDYGWVDLITSINVRGRGGADPEWGAFRNGIYTYLFPSGEMSGCWNTLE